MVDTKKIKAEVNQVVAEAESAASGLMGMITPRWNQFVAKWKTYSLRKKVITGVLIVAGIGVCWEFGISTGRLVVGSYRSAYAYGHGDYVTRTEVKAEKDNIIETVLASAPTKTQFNDLEAKVHQLEFAVDKLANTPAQITTGSISKKKKTAPIKSSAPTWFNFD